MSLNSRLVCSGVISKTCTGLAHGLPANLNFPQVDDLFAAPAADRSGTCAAEQRSKRRVQFDRLDGKQLAFRHDLVGMQLNEITAFFSGRGIPLRPGAQVFNRGDAQRATALEIDEGRGDFPIILDPQRAMAYRYPGDNFEPIYKTTGGFGDHQQPSAGRRGRQLEGSQTSHGDPHTQDLAGAQVAVTGGALLQKSLEGAHWKV